MMAELRELFKKREEAFKTQSEEIFASLPNVLDGCKRFVAHRGGDAEMLEWDDVNYLPKDENDENDREIVVLIGTISYNPGDSVTLPSGERVVVTENTVDYFKAMLRLGIPYELAVNGTSDQIYQFLDETIKVEHIEETDGHEPELEMVEDTPQPNSSGFNLDDLSAEQRAAVAMFEKAQNPSGDKKN